MLRALSRYERTTLMRKGQYLLDQSLGNQAFGLASIEAENARFMGRVYGWMTTGLCLTGDFPRSLSSGITTANMNSLLR